MHRFSSRRSIIRIRITAVLISLKWFCTTAAIICMVWGLIADDNPTVLAGLALLLTAMVLVIAQWWYAAGTRCPLCLTPVMASNGCSRNRKARKFLGSYRLQVALAVLFTSRFRCPYCAEPSILLMRNRG
jgi:hypothetical protein